MKHWFGLSIFEHLCVYSNFTCNKHDLDAMRLKQNGCHFADDIFKFISLNEIWCILIPTSFKFIREGPTDNKLESVQILTWHWIGDKPLSPPMMV